MDQIPDLISEDDDTNHEEAMEYVVRMYKDLASAVEINILKEKLNQRMNDIANRSNDPSSTDEQDFTGIIGGRSQSAPAAPHMFDAARKRTQDEINYLIKKGENRAKVLERRMSGLSMPQETNEYRYIQRSLTKTIDDLDSIGVIDESTLYKKREDVVEYVQDLRDQLDSRLSSATGQL